MIPQMTRFWFGIVVLVLMTVGAAVTAFAPSFPFIAYSSGLGGVYVVFAGSKAITDHLTCNGGNGGNGESK